MKNIDEMLINALSPTEKMSDEMINDILSQISKEKEQDMAKITLFGRPVRRASAVAAAAALVLVSSVTAFAAWRYLSAGDVSRHIKDEKLATQFETNNLLDEAETQTYGDYTVALLGVVSGKELSDFTENDSVDYGRTYVAVAIEKSDGTPISDEFDLSDIFVSPYIKGLNPAWYNAYTLRGGSSGFVANGVAYRVLETDTVEPFADCGVYVGVSDGTFYNAEAYSYDEETGEITRNESYEGLNALFNLPLDASKADTTKAQEIINRINSHDNDDEDADAGRIDEEVEAFMKKLTPANIDTYAVPLEETRQTVSVNENGEYSYGFELPDGAASNGTDTISNMFPDGKIGMSRYFGYSASDGAMEDLLIYTHTLNADGTVTFVVYVPRMN